MTEHEILMEQAAYHEADVALARALRDAPLLDTELARVCDGCASDAKDLVMQWVRQAARVRRIERLGAAGDLVKFDPVYYADFDEVGFVLGELTVVIMPPIVRGALVLLQGEVRRCK